LNILLLEPYFTGSHKQWANGLKQHSRHNIKILSLEGRFWKWRMHGGAVSLANQFLKEEIDTDLILATDMLDLTTFLTLTRAKTHDIPIVFYFHENQLSYPWSPTDRDVQANRDQHYGFINYASALASDKICFNSKYHQSSFLKELKNYLGQFPDNRLTKTVQSIEARSSVLPLGLNLRAFDQYKTENRNSIPTILWNHRWEYDKNPESFFNALFSLHDQQVDFRLIVVGENFSQSPDIFLKAKKILNKEIIHFGYAESFEEYARLLWSADILPVTSIQDFFGISIMEAVYCNTLPILPERLTYPELFTDPLFKPWFYSTENEMIYLLKNAILSFQDIRKNDYTSVANKYDWAKMINPYDELFESLLS